MKSKIFLIADNIRSMHNVGSLFRTADAFGVAKIYLCGYTPTPPRPEISKVALGAEKTVLWEHRASAAKLMKELKKSGVYTVALEQTRVSVAIDKFLIGRDPSLRLGMTKKGGRNVLALVVGNEVLGVSKTVLGRVDKIVHIPMRGKKESLNVSVAAGVALYALSFGSRRLPARNDSRRSESGG